MGGVCDANGLVKRGGPQTGWMVKSRRPQRGRGVKRSWPKMPTKALHAGVGEKEDERRRS